MSIKWNLIRLGGPVHGIVTKTVHKTLSGMVGAQGVGGYGGTGGGGSLGVGGGSVWYEIDPLSEIKDDNIKFVTPATILMYLLN